MLTYNAVSAATAVGDYHLRRTGLRIERVTTGAIDSAHGNTVDAVGVPIEVAVIITGSTVSRCEDEHGTLPSTSILNALHNRLLDEQSRRLHSLSIIRRTPTAGVDLVLLVGVVERNCFIRIRNHLRENPDTRNL